MYDDLGVALCLESVALGQKERAQFTEVLNFSVENDPNCAVFVGQRLVATVQVDD